MTLTRLGVCACGSLHVPMCDLEQYIVEGQLEFVLPPPPLKKN